MQVAEINSFFNYADTNSDGYISSGEMKKAMSQTNYASVRGLFRTLVSDDSTYNSQNFKILSQGDSKLSREEIMSMFTTYDDEDNVVVISDVQQTSLNANISNIAAVDTNKDGKITSDEISKAYKTAVKNNNTALQNFLEPYMTTNKKGKKIVNNDTFKLLATTSAEQQKGSGRNSYYIVDVKAMSMSDMLNFDVDKNGTLATAELQQQNNFQAYFYAIDTGKNGKISTSEIVKAYKNATDGSELKNALATLITEENGKVKINKQLFKQLSSGKNYLQINDLISLDTNNSGTLSADELTALFNKNCEYNKLDKNSDGKVTLSEINKYAKNNEDSLLATLFASCATSKEKSQLFKKLSNGKTYITLSELNKYDTNGDGTFSADEIAALREKMNINTNTNTAA